MKRFRKYVEQLDALLDGIEWGHRLRARQEAVSLSLNGGAASVLRDLVDPSAIRKAGAYFTGNELADKTIRPVTGRRGVASRPVYDPTCGAGDLLLRWADDLPVSGDLRTTLECWERLLRGCDLFPEFVGVAKRRLLLKAIARGARWQGGWRPKIDNLFRGLEEGDAHSRRYVQGTQTLMMNPPFNSVSATDDCDWSSGVVSLAAILFESCLKQTPPKTRFVAILPDVLRSGTRYQRWREMVSQRLDIARVERYGRFDSYADIDVFIIEGVVVAKERRKVEWWPTKMQENASGAVGDLFRVSVGAVVPHRDQHRGPWSPFATSRSVRPWSKVTYIGTRRRFDGTKVGSPFVAVRRTSSPRDSERAVGSIVNCDEAVSVENHLLVLKPVDGTLKSCELMLRNLRDPRTKRWLDERIRCRHLTVGSLRELPIWEDLV